MTTDDVIVEPLETKLCDCGKPETHAVWVDFRAVGQKSRVYKGCHDCALRWQRVVRAAIENDGKEW